MTPPPFRIAIAGLGTVGASVVNLLHHHAHSLAEQAGCSIKVTALSARDKLKKRSFSLSSLPWEAQWYEDPLSMANNAPFDAMVELIGGKDGVALDVALASLKRGCHLVSANKAMLAESGEVLWNTSQKFGKTIAFEAAVAGGIPIVKALKDSLAANTIHHVSGIINGTCNLILSRMDKEGGNLDDLIKDAQEQGFAEASPESDIEGFDTAHKIALIARIVFGRAIPFHDIPIEGITSLTPADMLYAKHMGFTLKLVGVANRHDDSITVAVFPALVPKNHTLYPIHDVMNCVSVEASPVGSLSFTGPGAGGGATASAVVADIIDLARHHRHQRPVQHLTPSPTPPTTLTHRGHYTCPFYLRFQVPDNHGVLATLSQVLADNLISVHSMSQQGHTSENSSHRVDLVFITHSTPQNHIDKALQKLASMKIPSSSQPLVSLMKAFRILSST